MNFSRAVSTVAPVAIRNVLVIGSGLMGSGIAQVAAQSNFNVTLCDVNNEVLGKASDSIRKSLQRVAAKEFKDKTTVQDDTKAYVDRVMGNIKMTTDLSSCNDFDLAIEAVKEDLEVKKIVFKQLESHASSEAIFASNTSSLSVEEMAKVTNRPDRFGGLHFFNPVPVMKLVEVVRGDSTSQATVDTLCNFSKTLGKTPVLCKDTNGFVVNRLLIPYLMESIRLYERGVASLQDIDNAMVLGAGYPMGPFKLLDYVGLDTCKSIIDGWHKAEPENPIFAPSPMLDKLVSEKKFGRKNGEGFYKY